MFAGRSFTIVLIANDYAVDTCSLVSTLSSRNRAIFAGELILDAIGLVVHKVDRPDQHIIRDIIQVSTIFQPETCHGNMISSTCAFRFNKQRKSGQVLAIPWLERNQSLQPASSRDYHYLYR